MTTIEERVRLGAAWLDANRPGWVDRIDLETLDLSTSCGCVLGQEFGDFDRAPDEVYRRAPQHGFNVPSNQAGTMRQYDNLTTAWRDYITARRAAA
jgi:hypothetical protein